MTRLRWRSEALTAGELDDAQDRAQKLGSLTAGDAGHHRQRLRCHCWTTRQPLPPNTRAISAAAAATPGARSVRASKREGPPKTAHSRTFPYDSERLQRPFKRQTAGSESLLKFRSHQEDRCHRASSWAGYLMEAKYRFPLQARTVIQEVQ